MYGKPSQRQQSSVIETILPHGNVAAPNEPAPHSPTSAASYLTSLSKVPVSEQAAYLGANDVQCVPFDSTLATIGTCLRQSEDLIQPCLDAGSRDQACETETSQCATAAEQAWQLYITHYLRLLQTALPFGPAKAGQEAWTAYLNAECDFETAPYPDDPAMRHNVHATCRAEKAQERALELRDTLINANN